MWPSFDLRMGWEVTPVLGSIPWPLSAAGYMFVSLSLRLLPLTWLRRYGGNAGKRRVVGMEGEGWITCSTCSWAHVCLSASTCRRRREGLEPVTPALCSIVWPMSAGPIFVCSFSSLLPYIFLIIIVLERRDTLQVWVFPLTSHGYWLPGIDYDNYFWKSLGLLPVMTLLIRR